MIANDILVDGFTRVSEEVHAVVGTLGEEKLTWRPDMDANSITWLIWHLTRVQDDHVSELRGVEQLWKSGGWASKFDLPFDQGATGYGHTSDEVALVRASGDLLLGYFDEVHAATLEFVHGLDQAAYERVVDTAWDPPVTLAVRLVSVLSDCLQHVGQAAYVRGLL